MAYVHEVIEVRGPFLVVCPLTVADGWSSELKKYCPTLVSKKWMGTKEQRATMQQEITKEIMAQPKSKRKDPDLPFHVMVDTRPLDLSSPIPIRNNK
jgi:SNF2 family DNA or RNA helicase